MNTLNKAQQKVIDSTASKLLVLAGAGTGKTHVMIEKISSIIRKGQKPESILALTFTNAAAFEMQSRFRKQNPHVYTPRFSTFHAFCYQLVASDVQVRHGIGYAAVPTIVDEFSLKRISKEVRLMCGTKMSDKMLAQPEDKIPECKKFEYQIYHKRFRSMLAKENVITFDMLADKVCKLFIEDSPIVAEYKAKYTYIFVDEFQDTDPLQWAFVQSFSKSKVMVVGDALQAIYGFRRSDSKIIKSLTHDDSWEVIKLYENYRSVKDIVDYANSKSTYADDNYRIELHTDKEGPKVDVNTHDNRANSRDSYSDQILSEASSYCCREKGTSAILVRTNAEVAQVTDFLKSKNIAYSTGKPDDALNILKSAGSTEFLLDWLPSFLRADLYANFLRILAVYPKPEDESSENSWKLSLLLKNFGHVYAIKEAMDKICRIRKIFQDTEMLPFIKCNEILNVLDISNIVVNTNASTPSEILHYLIDELENMQSNDLYVGTIHSSKGLEYDTVVLLGVNGPSFQLNSEEDNNLYYVGITRAKTHLLVIKNRYV